MSRRKRVVVEVRVPVVVEYYTGDDLRGVMDALRGNYSPRIYVSGPWGSIDAGAPTDVLLTERKPCSVKPARFR